MQEILNIIQNGETLHQDQMMACMDGIMSGQWSEPQIAAFLMGLSMRGETVDEITGAARIMREKAASISAPSGAVDCCGTGGDHSGSYNISTAVALVVAACGIPVAKHGNRSASSKSGAADVLEALGVNLDISLEQTEKALTKFGFAFLMAPNHHSAMKYVVPVRKALGVRTIFNLLGPLANPAGTQYQLIGVYDRKWVRPMAETLKSLGTKAAWVVHGADGMDEITTTDETYAACLKDGEITECVLTPEDFGIKRATSEDLQGGTPSENAKALSDLLNGKKSAYRDIVLVNSAAVIQLGGAESGIKVSSLKDTTKIAANAIDSGKAMEVLQKYASFSNGKDT
ncbi:MAG: anthranilate phosphoribosyltransferase [Alphaproteobacteria bacterium]|nr:anthranilate phosphoribosyltransferase [Alphaproteobacteria bacterium]